jgi:hypothetical protein
MVEPATTGALVAASLATAAGALARGGLGAAGRDTYERLKALFSGPAATSVAQLEETEGAPPLAKVVAALVDDAGAEDRARMRALAEELRAALAGEGHADGVEGRLTVIATDRGRAAGRDQYNAGRDQYVGSGPPETSREE